MRRAVILRDLGAKILAQLAPCEGGALLSVLILEAARDEQDRVVGAAYRALAYKYAAAVDAVVQRPAEIVDAHHAVARAVRDVSGAHPIPEYLRALTCNSDDFARMLHEYLAITPWCLPEAARAAARAHVRTVFASGECSVHNVPYMAQNAHALFESGAIHNLKPAADTQEISVVRERDSFNIMQVVTYLLVYQRAIAVGQRALAGIVLSYACFIGKSKLMNRDFLRRVFRSVTPLIPRCLPEEFWQLDTEQRMLLAYVCCVTGNEHRVLEFARNCTKRKMPAASDSVNVLLDGHVCRGLTNYQLDVMGALVFADYQSASSTKWAEKLLDDMYCLRKMLGTKNGKSIFRIVARTVLHSSVMSRTFMLAVRKFSEDDIFAICSEQCIAYEPIRVIDVVYTMSGHCEFVFRSSAFCARRLADQLTVVWHPRLFVFSDRAHDNIVRLGEKVVVDAYCKAHSSDSQVQHRVRTKSICTLL